MAEVFETVDWDYLTPFETPEYTWRYVRGRPGSTTTFCGAFRVWFNARFKRGFFDTWAHYERISKLDSTVQERVKCRYEAKSSGLAPMSSTRALLLSMLLSLAEDHAVLRWVVLVYSFAEVALQYRGQARSSPFKLLWTPILLRGVLPSVVGLVGTVYAQAVFLLIVSSLPFYRGHIRTVWVMEGQQMAADLVVQFFLSLLAIYFVAELVLRIDDDVFITELGNPFVLLVLRSFPSDAKYDLTSRDGWIVFGVGTVIVLAMIFAHKLHFGSILLYKGKFSHEHARTFYSWRIRKSLEVTRGLIEPSLAVVDLFFTGTAFLVIFALLFFVPTDPVIFFLTFLSYEFEIGYGLETDETLLTLFNNLKDYNEPMVNNRVTDLETIDLPSAPEYDALVDVGNFWKSLFRADVLKEPL